MAEYTREQLQSEIDSLAQKILQYTEHRTALSLAPILRYVRFLCMSDCGNVAVVAENETTMPRVRELVVRSYRKLFPELGHLVLSSFYLTHDERHYLFADDNARARDFSNSIRCYAVFDTTQSDLGELTQEPETLGAETSASGVGGILNLTWKHKLIIIVDSNLDNIVLLAELGATVMEVKELVARAHNQWCPEYGQVTVSSLYLRLPSGDEPAPSDDSRIGDSYPENTLLIELLVNFTAALAGDLTQNGELTQERATCTAGVPPNEEANDSAFRSDEGMAALMQIPDAGERESPVSGSMDEPILTQDAANYIRINREATQDTSVHLAHNSAAALAGDLTQNEELTQERVTCTAPFDEANESAFRSDEGMGAVMQIPYAGERESPVSRSLETQNAANFIRINQEATYETSVHLAHNSATTHGALLEIPDSGGRDGLAQVPAIDIGSIQNVHLAEFDTIKNGASDLRWFLEKAHAQDSEHVAGTNSGGSAHEMLQAERELVIGVHNSEKKKFIMNKDLQDQKLVNTSEETDVFAKQTECLETSMLEHGNQIKGLSSSAGDGGYNTAPADASHDMNVDACNEHRAWKESPLSHVYDDENMMQELLPTIDGSGLDCTRKSRAANSKRLSKQASKDSLQSSRPLSERKRFRSGLFALLDSTEKLASIPSSLRQVSQAEIAALNAMKGCKVLFTTSTGETIREQDLLDLVNGKWVNSEIINSYLHLIKLRADRQFHVDGSSSIRVYIYSSFFFTKYATEGYAGVSKWTKNVNIFDFDLVLFPINQNGVHWSLVGAHLKKHQISYYDSLRHKSGTRSYHSVMNSLVAYLDSEVPNTRRNWQQKIEEVPQQADGVSCGIYVCAFAELLARGVQPPFAFSARDTPRLLRGVAADIMRAYVC